MKTLVVFLLLLFALGLASAAPRPFNDFPFVGGIDFGTQGKKSTLESEAKSQWIGTVLSLLPYAIKGVTGIAKGAKGIAKYIVCDELAQLQQYTDSSEDKDAKIMALVNVMGDFLTAKEMDKFKQLNMKDNRIAEAELFDWAKEYLCD